MTESTAGIALPHAIARAEIDAWRGRCLDLFARTERAVGQTLECAVDNNRSTKFRHLAGQRLDDLIAMIALEPATARQENTLRKALEGWREIEPKRVFLAHAIVNELWDRRGCWYAVFDVTTYKTNISAKERWSIGKSEALEFENDLGTRYKMMSGQLGQLRKRLAI